MPISYAKTFYIYYIPAPSMSRADCLFSDFALSPPDTPCKQTLGLITRKPEKKGSFIRKKNSDCQIAEVLPAPISTRFSKEKYRGGNALLQHQRSLELIRPQIQGEIKFLSPKNCRSSKIISPNQGMHAEKSPKFSRKGKQMGEDPYKLGYSSYCDENILNDQFAPIISKISLESFIGKGGYVETRTNTRDDWVELQLENQKLKEQNCRLLEEMDKIKEELQKAILSKSKNTVATAQTNSFLTKCKNCEQRQRKGKREIKTLELRLADKQKEIIKYKTKIFDIEVELDRERARNQQMSEEIHQMALRLDEGQKIQIELTEIIAYLKAKIGSDAEEMRYLGIQHSVLLRKKHQCELSRAEAAKLSLERQALKRMVGEYKEKIEVLRKVFTLRKQPRQRVEKEKSYDDLLELSSEQSTDGY